MSTSASSRQLGSLRPISKELRKSISVEGLLCIMCDAKCFTLFHLTLSKTPETEILLMIRNEEIQVQSRVPICPKSPSSSRAMLGPYATPMRLQRAPSSPSLPCLHPSKAPLLTPVSGPGLDALSWLHCLGLAIEGVLGPMPALGREATTVVKGKD